MHQKQLMQKLLLCGEPIEKDYNYIFTIKIAEGEYKGKRFYLSVKKSNEKKLEYGDYIEFIGEYTIPNTARNYKGFDYREYLKSKKIYGNIKVNNNSVKIIEKNRLNILFKFSYKIRNYIIKVSDKLLKEDTSKLLTGILIGDKSKMPEDIIVNFKTSNLSHMLSVSGAHTSYIILGITYILDKSKISRKRIYVITILSLILFMFITNFTVSVTRASIMSILVLGANIIYRKSDIWTTISISLLIILILNPFSINEIGMQLSYLGTIGIILFSTNVEKILNKMKIKGKISKLLSVTICAQIAIMPIMAIRFNNISLTFFISNILASPFLGINIILGFITVFISLISYFLARLFAIPLNFSLKTLIFTSSFTSKIPLSSIVIKTPYIISIIFIYILILILNYIYTIHNSNLNLRLFQKKMIKKKNIKVFLSIIIIIIVLFNAFSYFYLLIPKDLKIYFIDVGQGDSCLIITPNNKKILIDGGEGDTDVLLSYLLDRRIKAIDYIMISHFDSDHCNGLIEVIQKLKIKNILISKQAYFCDEYKNIAKIINSKKIKVTFVKQGDKLNIDKNIKLDIFYPPEKLEYEDLNNNSIVAKLSYNKFTILFTGDIEKSEENILNKYNQKDLESTIIKIAHHGSKTSSSKEFIKAVKPKIALIGVGKNNKFGHPNVEVLERLRNVKCKIYRTDEMGEIEIKVNGEGKIWTRKMLN